MVITHALTLFVSVINNELCPNILYDCSRHMFALVIIVVVRAAVDLSF